MSDIYSPEELDSLWFGARVRPGTSPLQVASVQLESLVGKAGLRAGDLILQVNGKAPRSFMQFIQHLHEIKDNEDVVLSTQRGNEKRKVSFKLLPEKDFFNAELVRKKIGAALQEMTPELAEGLGLNWRGLLVSGVDRGTAAADAELQRGMLITSIDGQAIGDVRTAAKRLYTKAKGDKVVMDVVMPRHRGAFLQYLQGRVELAIR
jgi:S1-C subfamily serine protease